MSPASRRVLDSAIFQAERAARLLPAPARASIKSSRHLVDPPLVALYRRRTGDRSPIPPSEIRLRAGGVGVRTYLEGGRQHAGAIERVLEDAGHRLDEFHAILDFGSGAGRVLRHLQPRAAEGALCVGSDVDAGAIAWARQNLAARFVTNQAVPPLSFADDSFDLIYSYSVFTHLGEELQLRWLAELSRVLRPGGMALLTVHGARAYELFRSERLVSHSRSCARRIADHGSLEREGIVFEPYEISRWDQRDFPGVGDFGMTFHAAHYIRERWSRWFEVLDVLPDAAGMHDVVRLTARDR